MKKIAIVLALSLGLISCSDKESASTASSSSVKTLTTIEDYADEMIRIVEELAATFEATTPENSAQQAKKLKEIKARGEKLEKEAESKFGKEAWDKIGEQDKYNSRAEAALQRIFQWIMENASKQDQFAPEFNELMNS